MAQDPSDLDTLWGSAQPASAAFDPASVAHLPAPVRQYLAHAIAPGTPLASAVRLRMHGVIKLASWRPFRAEQVIVLGRGMISRAEVKIAGIPMRGIDRYLDGAGALRWRLGGIFPVRRANGPDVTRSEAGRFAVETIWLPSRLCDDSVSWNASEADVACAHFAVGGSFADLTLMLSQGSLQSASLPRWGNPAGGPYREVAFGAFVEQEATFGGYTIPARMWAGWYFGSDRFDEDGRFLHATVDDATFR